jgi:hypothetical protein
MIKSFTEFINESEDSGLSFEELSQLVEVGLMSSDEAKAELRKQMKARIQPGTSPFDDVNYEALKASPTIQATRLPEAQPFLDAGFKPASSIQQISNGTLYFKKDSSMWTAGIYFMSQSKYVRKDGGDRMQVMAKDLPGEGIEFYKNAMKWVSDKYDLTSVDVTTKTNSNRAASRAQEANRVRAELADTLPNDTLFTGEYIDHLIAKRKGPALERTVDEIRQHPDRLPIYVDDMHKVSRWIEAARHSVDNNRTSIKFYAAIPIMLYYWSEPSLKRLIEGGWLDVEFGKPITIRNR